MSGDDILDCLFKLGHNMNSLLLIEVVLVCCSVCHYNCSLSTHLWYATVPRKARQSLLCFIGRSMGGIGLFNLINTKKYNHHLLFRCKYNQSMGKSIQEGIYLKGCIYHN